jgi:hypothetical protein
MPAAREDCCLLSNNSSQRFEAAVSVIGVSARLLSSSFLRALCILPLAIRNRSAPELLCNVADPLGPIRRNAFISSLLIALVVDVEHKVNKCVCVVHPAQTEHDGCMKSTQVVDRQGLNDEGDEDGEGRNEDRCRLLLYRHQFHQVYPAVVEKRVEGRGKAE